MQLLRVLPEYSWTTIRLLAAFPDSLDASTCYLRTMPPSPLSIADKMRGKCHECRQAKGRDTPSGATSLQPTLKIE